MKCLQWRSLHRWERANLSEVREWLVEFFEPEDLEKPLLKIMRECVRLKNLFWVEWRFSKCSVKAD